LPPKLVAGGAWHVEKHVDSIAIASRLEGWRGSGLDLDRGGEWQNTRSGVSVAWSTLIIIAASNFTTIKIIITEQDLGTYIEHDT